MSSIDRSVAPPILPYRELQIPFPKILSEDSLLPIYDLNHGDQPINRITVQWKYGSAMCSNPGAYAVMSQLLREGAGNHSAQSISETLDYNGAWLKITPSEHLLSISLFSINKTLGNLIPILSDIIQNPIFPENEMHAISERFASQTEVNMQRVGFKAAMLSRELTFGKDHPLAKTPSPEAYRGLTKGDIIGAYREVVSNSLPIISVAGQTSDILPLVKDFAKMLERDLPKAVNPFTPIPFTPSAGRHETTVDGALQGAIRLTIPTVNRSHADYIDLRLAVMALGGYFGSRLNKNIREDKGYTYGITASLLGYEEGAFMEIKSEADPAYVDSVVYEINNEIKRLADEPMSDEELSSVRSFATTTLAAMLDSPFTMMDHHLTNIHNNIASDYFARQLSAINNLTPGRISEVIRRHIDLAKSAIAIAGPKKL